MSLLDGFRQGLRDHGYIEGKNIIVEYRFAEGKVDRIPSLVAELVQLNVDAIVSSNFTAIRAAKQATKTIPVVMVTTEDPVAGGIIESLARPGGNITGLTRLTYDSGGKRLEMLKELAPTITRVGFLMTEDRTGGVDLKDHEASARASKVQMQSLVVKVRTRIWMRHFEPRSRAAPTRSWRVEVPCSTITRNRSRTLR